MTETTRAEIEEQLAELPIIQFAWMTPKQIAFSENARAICRQECPRYGKSWSCPPGVGTVEQCRNECAAYDGVLVFTTIAEVHDVTNMEETLATRAGHQDVTRRIQALLEERGLHTLPLAGESCDYCGTCAYPDGPCRYPQRRISCVEGFGIVVPLVAEQAGMEFDNGYNTVTWFGMVYYKTQSGRNAQKS